MSKSSEVNTPCMDGISFLPDGYLERKAARRSFAICSTVLLIASLGVGTGWMLSQKSNRQVEVEHTAIERNYTEAVRRIDLVKQMQEQQRRLSAQAELTASLLEKVPRSYLLAEITNCLPADTSLMELNVDSKVRPSVVNGKTAKKETDPKAGATFEPKLYDVTMKLIGVADTDTQVAAFIAKLSRSTLLKDVNLIYTDELLTNQSDIKRRKFQIEMSLNPAANLTASAPVRTAAVELN